MESDAASHEASACVSMKAPGSVAISPRESTHAEDNEGLVKNLSTQSIGSKRKIGNLHGDVPIYSKNNKRVKGKGIDGTITTNSPLRSNGGFIGTSDEYSTDCHSSLKENDVSAVHVAGAETEICSDTNIHEHQSFRTFPLHESKRKNEERDAFKIPKLPPLRRRLQVHNQNATSENSIRNLTFSSKESPPKHKKERKFSHEDQRVESHIDIFNIKSRFDSNDEVDSLLTEVDRSYKRVALYSVLIWLFLTSIAFYMGNRRGNLERLTGVEQIAPKIACILLGASIFGTALPFLIRRKAKDLSGVMICAIVVQCVAFLTDLMMVVLPTPVFVDPMCGTRVYLLRWCEWSPLAFVMTYLAESCRVQVNIGGDKNRHNMSRGFNKSCYSSDTDSSISENEVSSFQDDHGSETSSVSVEFLRPAYTLACCQGMSTACGFMFPFCPGPLSWCIIMSVSFILYLTMFYRLRQRINIFNGMKKGDTVAAQEIYEWSRLSLDLLKICAALWTGLVLAFFVYSVGPLMFPQSMFSSIFGLPMICESTVDVLFKSIYMLIIAEVHDNIFDESLRSERRLQEMRQMMGAVWSNSSDIICISVKNAGGGVSTMVSPTYRKLYGNAESASTSTNERSEVGARALSFELKRELFEDYNSETEQSSQITLARKYAPKLLYDMEFGTTMGVRKAVPIEFSSLEDEEIGSIAHLVVRAWNTFDDETEIMHDLIRTKEDPKISFQCEAKITKMEDNAILIVVRDISERFKRFEAEKKVISESTARQKDAAANRFTRHEVKNGLLEAIGLCDSLRESSNTQHNACYGAGGDAELLKNDRPPNDQLSKPRNLSRCLFELDKTLNEILDTVLADAMARDVIHGVYEPKLERVHLSTLLNTSLNLNSDRQIIERFPITTTPHPLPDYALDPQLVKYIHRNAISNACKYGKRGGKIRTEVSWDWNYGVLTIDVINLPGPGHREILKLGEMATKIVFSSRRRLEIHASKSDKTMSHSAGDGAWIMKKCAQTLKGSCDIKFSRSETIFRFKCPAVPYDNTLSAANISYEDYEMPKNVWGIALDDSKIQRKLLVRFFMYAGLPQDRVHIKGGTSEEIKAFHDWAVNFIADHPNDYFLMIIDENLDIQEEGNATRQMTISGSLAISKMRSQLSPDQEARVFALIRSANDSASDVAIYNTRAHGFLPKAPIKKKSLREVLVPMWLTRFPALETCNVVVPRDSVSNNDEQSNEIIITIMDLLPCISDIDSYASLSKDQFVSNWKTIWEKLHALKGDLLIMPNQPRIRDAIDTIKSFRGEVPPTKFHEGWTKIRTALLSVNAAAS